MLNLLQNANNVMLPVKLVAIYFKCPAIKSLGKIHSRIGGIVNINPNPTEVLYAEYKPESNSFHTFNHYLLISRYYVYLARNKFLTQELEVFIVLLEIKIQCEREIT